MSKSVLFFIWLAASVLLWWLLGAWIVSGAERFYALLVPLALIAVGLLSEKGWQTAREQGRNVAGCFAVLLVACSILGGILAVQHDLPLGRVWLEVYWFSYLATSVIFLMMGGYVAVQWLLLKCLRRGTPAGDRPSVPVLVKAASLLLLMVLGVPYLLGVFFIHRVKVPNIDFPESRLGRPVEEVAFQSEDGLNLRGWFIPCQDASSTRTLIICHGASANSTLFLPYVQVGDALKAHVLLFDFRGHGNSDGHTCTVGHREKLDVLAAARYVREQRPHQAREVVALGASMGAASLARAAAEVEPPFDAVILDSGFAAAVDLTDNVLHAFPDAIRPGVISLALPFASLHGGCWIPEVRPVDAVARIRAPVLIIHAQHDELIPTDHARQLFQQAREPRHLWITPTVGHGSALRALPDYLKHVERLMESKGLTTASR